MKNFKKGFTLVEMLIVVVIIGILAAALLPKLGGAQAAARDAARVANLKDLSTAVSIYLNDKGSLPVANLGTVAGLVNATNFKPLLDAGTLTVIPSDPQKSTSVDLSLEGFGANAANNGFYQYALISRNGDQKAAMVIIQKVENEKNANWVVGGNLPKIGANTLNSTESVIPCTSVVLNSKAAASTRVAGGECIAKAASDLRRIDII